MSKSQKTPKSHKQQSVAKRQARPVVQQNTRQVRVSSFEISRKFPPQFFRPIRNLQMLPFLTFVRSTKATKSYDKLESLNVTSSAQGPLGGVARPVAAPKSSSMPQHGAKGTGLSPCALGFAKAVSNPFGQFEELPCIPCSPPVPSYRFRNVVRGSFQTSGTGTNNVGFIMVAPYDPRNNANSVWMSSSGTTPTSFSKVGVGTSAVNRTGLPFASAAFPGAGTPSIQGKLVSLGLRVRNISKSLNVGGIMFGITVPSDTSLEALTQAQVSAYPGTQLIPQALSDQVDWSTLIQRPTDVTDLDYLDTGAINTNATLGFLIVAPGVAATDAQTFEFEIIEFWEFIGTSGSVQVPEVQLSHADEVGLSRVLQAAQEMPVSLDQDDINRQMAEGLVDAMAHSDTTARTVEDLMGLAGLPLKAIGTLVSSLVSFLAL